MLASRYHDFSAGHRVVGHESKCKYIHGHNYRVHFFCVAEGGNLDTLGRVIDFSVIKTRLCQWLEDCWDHRLLLWEADPLRKLFEHAGAALPAETMLEAVNSLFIVPFNPTAENMALFLLHLVGPAQLDGTGVKLKRVIVEETRKCAVELEA